MKIRNAISKLTVFMATITLVSPWNVYPQTSPFPDRSEIAGKPAGTFAIKLGTFHNYKADFGRILVPENRNKENSRLMHLVFIRVHALNDNTREPVFLLNGGPGKTNVRGILSPLFFTYNDLVIVGYRGIDSSITLESPEIGKAMTVNNPLSESSLEHIREVIKSEFRKHVENNIDIDGFTVLEVVDDLDLIREVLGYSKINLFASSYGSILAYLYCQKFPGNTNRNLMVGASNINRKLIRYPDAIDHVMREYGERWKRDPIASQRTPDILKTIQNVLLTLPPDWNGIPLDKDKIKLCTYWFMYETEEAAQIFDAFVAAENGDFSGLALLCYGYDDELLKWVHLCDYFAKANSLGPDPTRNYVKELDPPDSILGSPSCKLFWATASQGAWPIKSIPNKYLKLDSCDVETLIVMGNLDPSSPVEYVREMKSYLTNGQLLVLSDMGHMDPSSLQHEAFNHMGQHFLSTGMVDSSKFTFNKVNFTPTETLQDYAKEVFKEMKK